MAAITIRPLGVADYQQWRQLYQGYADFYKVPLTDAGVQTTWSWLMATGHVCNGLVAIDDDTIIGLAHFRGMPSPLRGHMVGFLDDLFVVPDHRSSGAAAALMAAVKQHAIAANWGVVRWITRDNNYRARGLYDKLAQKTDWALYEMTAK
jgi:GNAT superfamily N-acetyltransferase